MKVCITSSGNSLDAYVGERFGRCRYFIIVDTETGDFEVIPNKAHKAESHAGITASKTLDKNKVDVLITGKTGAKAFYALESYGIRIYDGASSKDTVKEVLEKFKQKEYKDAMGPSGCPDLGRAEKCR